MSTSSKTIDSIEELRELLGKPHPLTVSKIGESLNDSARTFLQRTPLLFMATSGSETGSTVSPKGDEAGFIQVLDDKTLHIPERPGNKLMQGLGNILETGQIGLLAVIPGSEETLRINGRARLLNDPALNQQYAARGKPAQLVIEVTVEQMYFHCAKAFKRSKAWQHEAWLPPHKISWGDEISTGKLGKSKSVVNRAARKTLSKLVDKAVEDDYKNNL